MYGIPPPPPGKRPSFERLLKAITQSLLLRLLIGLENFALSLVFQPMRNKTKQNKTKPIVT